MNKLLKLKIIKEKKENNLEDQAYNNDLKLESFDLVEIINNLNKNTDD